MGGWIFRSDRQTQALAWCQQNDSLAVLFDIGEHISDILSTLVYIKNKESIIHNPVWNCTKSSIILTEFVQNLKNICENKLNKLNYKLFHYYSRHVFQLNLQKESY